jgi:hypothetical protein
MPIACPICFGALYSRDDELLCPVCGYLREEPPKPPPPKAPFVTYVAGLDLGQMADYTAFAGLRRTEDASGVRLDLLSLHRWDLGTSYPTIVDQVSRWMTRPPYDEAPLAVDRTGVGAPVVDMFRAVGTLQVVPVHISAGQTSHKTPDHGWNVPKKDLVASLQTLLSRGRLGIVGRLKLAKTLTAELKKFSAKITPAGNETYSSWRERDHDDLVLAVALACWASEHCSGGPWIFDPPKSARSVLDNAPDVWITDKMR